MFFSCYTFYFKMDKKRLKFSPRTPIKKITPLSKEAIPCSFFIFLSYHFFFWFVKLFSIFCMSFQQKIGGLFFPPIFIRSYFVIDKILYFIIPAGACTSITWFFFAPSKATPIGDSFEILLAAKSTSVEPTIV